MLITALEKLMKDYVMDEYVIKINTEDFDGEQSIKAYIKTLPTYYTGWINTWKREEFKDYSILTFWYPKIARNDIMKIRDKVMRMDWLKINYFDIMV